MDRWGVAVVGSGAGGATLAHRLASTGKKVLVLERGDWLPRERENWDVSSVVGEGRYRSKQRWIDRDGAAFSPFTHHWVGGNTKMYGAALFRLRERDMESWPVRYGEMAPYYSAAEKLYSVRGLRGLDPTEPPASEPYPHPPLPHEPRVARLAEQLRAAGLRPFPLPIGIRDNEGGAPVVLSLFDGYPDPTRTKADAEVSALLPALAHGNVTLWTRSYVERLEVAHGGREVTALEVVRTEEDGTVSRIRVAADIVAVAAGAIESAALLLRSGEIANRSGMVGRNYMSHHNGALIWVSRRTENDARFQKTLAITDWYDELGSVQLMGRSQLMELQSLAVGAIDDQPLAEIAARSIDFWLTAEDKPEPRNRITLDPRGTIQISYWRNSDARYQALRARLEGVLRSIEPDSRFLGYELGVSGVSHQNGTLRFGDDPKTSVLDRNCRAHDLDNLYCVDASFFPSCGAVNPSLTIMANALRVGDHLAERLR